MINYDVAVLIGRFQPLHQGHMQVILRGLDRAKRLIIVVGSAYMPRCYRNPFTFDERAEMIRNALRGIAPFLLPKVEIVPLPDLLYNDEQWITNARELVGEYLTKTDNVSLIGHAKDSSSYYQYMFPTWGTIKVDNYQNIAATPMRNAYFSNIAEMWLKDCDGHKDGDTIRDRLVPTAVKQFLDAFIKTPDYKYVYDEYEYVTEYQKPYLGLPYKPTFVTVDACVIQSGHVLLVKRKTQPGKGLWALPGGFVNNDETINDATFRELIEETTIDLPERILRGSAKTTKVFDDPFRSSRGRTITHGSLIHLERRRKLPTVKGADDAEKTWWCPLADIRTDFMFEDHFSIIRYFQGQL